MGIFDDFLRRTGRFPPRLRDESDDSTSTDSYSTRGLTPLQMEQNKRTGTRINWQAGEDGAFVSPRIYRVEDAVPTGEKKG